MVYEVTNFGNTDSYPMVANALSGVVKLTKNADINKYKYFGYGIGFDRHGSHSHPSGGNERNVIIFGVDMSPSVHVDNKKRHFNYWKRSNTRIR